MHNELRDYEPSSFEQLIYLQEILFVVRRFIAPVLIKNNEDNNRRCT